MSLSYDPDRDMEPREPLRDPEPWDDDPIPDGDDDEV